MNIYLAGPMRGIPEFNFPAFHEAAANLRARGHTVFSPAENDVEKGYSQQIADYGVSPELMRNCILDDLTYIIREADAIALLPGWENSKGVAAELATAEFLGLDIIYINNFPKSKQSLTDVGEFLERTEQIRRQG